MEKGLAKRSEAMSQAMRGQLRHMGPSQEFQQNALHWRKRWQSTPVVLPGEPHKQHQKAKGHNTGR